MELFTGDTTVQAYTTGARAVVVTLVKGRHVTFDLMNPVYATETIAQLWMSAIAAGIAAGIPSKSMNAQIFTVA